jgi:crotonobetainyl-CoA:carnitine CoA-transferase CaiB-like acyl-CoA transferase
VGSDTICVVTQDLVQQMQEWLGLPPSDVRVVGSHVLPSAFRVSDLAVASIAAAGTSLTSLVAEWSSSTVTVDRDLAAHWFGMSIRPDGWTVPALWDAVAGDYPAADGWIRLHTNAAPHRRAALSVLGVPADRSRVAEAVSRFGAVELEDVIVAAGGAAAAMRSIAGWRDHPQGVAVASEPLVATEQVGAAPPLELPGSAVGRPLQGVRVLDLTRVLAGPVATRLLAGWGADVLRVDPPDWDEPGVIPEVLLGKRTARLDLTSEPDRARFRELLAGSDVLVHGYRSDALERLGFGAEVRQQLRPGLVDVSLDAYGWSGPWATRRGFDSLVQMSTGIADAGMRAYHRDRPTPLPVQALDHATGYLIAAAALRGLAARRTGHRGSRWRLSLARTAKLLVDSGPGNPDSTPPGEPELAAELEQTAWGPARRVLPPLDVPGAPLRWDLPARALGSDPPTW